MSYSNDLKKFFPEYDCKLLKETITFTENEKKAKVKSITWTYPIIHSIDPNIVKDLKSFFNKANAHNIFNYDCDGIFICEKDHQKYLIFNELKSTFDSNDIFHAKEQIISSYLKINLISHLLVGYKSEEFKIKGFIFSLAPEPSYIQDLHQKSFFPPDSKFNKESEFVTDLLIRNKTIYNPRDLYSLKGMPLGERGIFNIIELKHISVPKEGSITLNLDDFLS